MNNLSNKNIVIGNVITRSAQSFNLVEKRIIMLGIAKLGGISKEIKITAQEYAETFDLDMSTAYHHLIDNVENLRKRYLTYQIKDDKKTGRAVVNWLQGYEYYEKEGYVKFMFSQYLFPYLFDLQNQFTKYKLKQACALRSVYSWRLLELIESMRNSTPTQIDSQGNITKTTKLKEGWLSMTIDEFNHAMETPKSCQRNFGDLKKRIIEPAIRELEQKDNWKIEYKTIKKGRKVAILEFEFYRDPQGRLF